MRRHFYTRPWAHVIFLVLFVGGPVVLGVWLETDPSQPRGTGWLAGLVFLGIGQLMYLPLFWYQRLIVSPEGIRARAPFVSVPVAWENVERLYRGRADHVGLVLKTPSSDKTASRWVLFSGGGQYWRYDEAESQWLAEGRYLSLSPFDHAIRRGTLQREMARYDASLPGLDADEEHVPAAERAATLRVVVLILGFTAVWLTVAMMVIPKVFPDENGQMNWRVPFILYAGTSLQCAAFAFAAWTRKRRYWTFINGAMSLMMAVMVLVVWYSRPNR